MNIKCFLIIVNVLILCIIISTSPADTPDSLKASTFSKNISDNYNEKIETQKYSSYSGTTACCPPGRSCEFNPDYESCICNPSDYDPYCMYDGCEEVIVKGRKKCSCPCKGYIPYSYNQNPNSIPEPSPVSTPKPIQMIITDNSHIAKPDKSGQEEPSVNINIQILSGRTLIFDSNKNKDNNILVQSGEIIKFEIVCNNTNIPGEMSIQEKGRTLSDKHVSKGGAQNLSYTFQATKNKELSVVFSDVENNIIFDKIFSIIVEKPEPMVISTYTIGPEKTIPPQSGLTAVISSKKNSVVNN